MRSWYLMKKSRGARLATQVVQDGAYFHGDVGKVVQHLCRPGKVVGVPAEVRRDERCFRMPAEDVVALRQQLFERHATGLVVASIGEQGELRDTRVHAPRFASGMGQVSPVMRGDTMASG
jgi:hypothetical protein